MQKAGKIMPAFCAKKFRKLMLFENLLHFHQKHHFHLMLEGESHKVLPGEFALRSAGWQEEQVQFEPQEEQPAEVQPGHPAEQHPDLPLRAVRTARNRSTAMARRIRISQRFITYPQLRPKTRPIRRTRRAMSHAMPHCHSTT